MIRVEVEDYCHACLDFKADVTEPERMVDWSGQVVQQTDTIIRCTYRKRCANIKRFLEHQMKENND